MRCIRLPLLLTCLLSCTACFQFSTVLSIKGDGSGIIQQRILFTTAALTQIRQLAVLGGGRAQEFDPLSEQQARDAAGSLGPGVTYVSSTPINTSEGQGRDITYSFTNVNQLRILGTPPAPGGLSVSAPNLGTDTEVSFALTPTGDGHSLLKITIPQLPIVSGGGAGGSPTAGNIPSADQVAMVRPMFAGAKLAIVVEPAGRLVRTSSPYVEGQRVTLFDVNIDALLGDDAVLQRLRGAASVAEAREILKGVPGVKVNLDPEITIEFIP